MDNIMKRDDICLLQASEKGNFPDRCAGVALFFVQTNFFQSDFMAKQKVYVKHHYCYCLNLATSVVSGILSQGLGSATSVENLSLAPKELK